MTIKNDITAFIDSTIDSMTTAGGYNFNYDNVNEYDPSDRSYPSVMTSYQIIEAEDLQQNGKYTSTMNGLFEVTVDNSADVDLLMSKVIEDFQKMFYDNYDTFRTAGMLAGRHQGHDTEYFLNKLRPGRIIIRWDIPYRVSMSDPSST